MVNGLSPGVHRAIIEANDSLFSIVPLRIHFNEILIEIRIYSFKKIYENAFENVGCIT